MRSLFVVGLGFFCTIAAAADRQTMPPVPPAPVPSSTAQPAGTSSTTSIGTPSPTGATSPPTQPACDAAAATAASRPTPNVTAEQIIALVDAGFQAHPQPAGFKCELIALNPKQISDVFGNKDWVALGKADVSASLWKKVVRPAIGAALSDSPPKKILWYSPATGLGVTVPNATSTPDQYVMLMFFEEDSMKLYWNGHQINGTRPINDNRPWRDILMNAGISLTSQSSSSN